MPTRVRKYSGYASAAAFMVASLAIGFGLGQKSVAVTQYHVETSRHQRFDQMQCFIDYLSLEPETRFEQVDFDSHLVSLCNKVQDITRPNDHDPDVGDPPFAALTGSSG